ncbi:MAG TPA: tRNA (guanosine(46)-N7)-methyltransferase TrmB [Candidatus Limihabitans stercoravium]|nr:tRNA (guanosine(46)-N7)-methyltransferase TrmB [Candidatus Limihabitans stercoravium]
MRMRRKKNLDQRISNCNEMLAIVEGDDFYTIPQEQRVKIKTSKDLFGNDNRLVVEIGCGKGQFSVKYATLNPTTNLLAVEKLSNVIVEACEKAHQSGLKNLLFANCGAENLPLFLPAHSVSEILINFPCPYPKKTYANRRVTHPNYLKKFQHLLTENGVVRLKTDNLPYFEYSLEQMQQFGFKLLKSHSYVDVSPSDNIMTEYETKFVSQHMPIYYAYLQL